MKQAVQIKLIEHDKFEVNIPSEGHTLYVDKPAEGYKPAGPNPLEIFLSSLGTCTGVYAKLMQR